MYKTIICTDELLPHVHDHNWIVIDCRYDLADPGSGHRAYMESHISDAIYADLHDDLSGEPLTDHGRHPLPGVDKLRRVFSSYGITKDTQVVAYDASSGAFAARLWWLLRYMGHDAVAVLNGGWQAWQSENMETESGPGSTTGAIFDGQPRSEWLVTIDEVAGLPCLVDSREAARYLGEMEPVDPVAGHIPGAINHCWKENLAENGHFLAPNQLQQQFNQIYTDTPAEQVVFYCGSGVTACHNLLAVSHAGLPAARLYAGSWSEWCSQADRPIATGPEPV
jgi:thiosulfate/3-mercaptopyruvate sulfurtransferase